MAFGVISKISVLFFVILKLLVEICLVKNLKVIIPDILVSLTKLQILNIFNDVTLYC